MAETEGPEETFKVVLELPDNMPEKADYLAKFGDVFERSFLDNTHRKEDIDNCVLAYESAVHLTPQAHSDMSIRLNKLGASLYHRFNLAGDLTDISKAISYQQKALHLIPEGHEEMRSTLNNLGIFLQRRFSCTGDLADMSNAISYKQKAVHLTPEGHAEMPSLLNNLGNLSFFYSAISNH